jgi:hypothetical protein
VTARQATATRRFRGPEDLCYCLHAQGGRCEYTHTRQAPNHPCTPRDASLRDGPEDQASQPPTMPARSPARPGPARVRAYNGSEGWHGTDGRSCALTWPLTSRRSHAHPPALYHTPQAPHTQRSKCPPCMRAATRLLDYCAPHFRGADGGRSSNSVGARFQRPGFIGQISLD